MEAPALKLADFTNPKASGFGVVPGDMAGPKKSYKKTRKWATALDQAGFDGIINVSRFAGPSKCIFMFGPGGLHVNGAVLTTHRLEDWMKQQMRWVSFHDPLPSSSIVIV